MAWTLEGNIKGVPGAAGVQFYSGNANPTDGPPPTPAGSKAGDLFLNTATGDLFKLTGAAGAETWTVGTPVANLKGPTGQGLNLLGGVAGVPTGGNLPPGVTGAGNPAKPGDGVIDTGNGHLYIFAGGTTWTDVGQIKGDDGVSNFHLATAADKAGAFPAAVAGTLYVNHDKTAPTFDTANAGKWAVVGDVSGTVALHMADATTGVAGHLYASYIDTPSAWAGTVNANPTGADWQDLGKVTGADADDVFFHLATAVEVAAAATTAVAGTLYVRQAPAGAAALAFSDTNIGVGTSQWQVVGPVTGADGARGPGFFVAKAGVADPPGHTLALADLVKAPTGGLIVGDNVLFQDSGNVFVTDAAVTV